MPSTTHSFQEMLLPGGYLASGGVTLDYTYSGGSSGSYWDPPEPAEIEWTVERVDGLTVYYPEGHECEGEAISEEDMIAFLPMIASSDDDTIERILRETEDDAICEAIEEAERNTDHFDYDPRDWQDEGK